MDKLNEQNAKKLESLKYHGNLSPNTVEQMSKFRAKVYALAAEVLALGGSRETSEAFTCLENAQMYINKHLCMIDPQAVKEDIKEL